MKAAIQIPHPWTRSVNGLVFLTGKEGYPDLKGHGIGCEYNGRFLIRFTTQARRRCHAGSRLSVFND